MRASERKPRSGTPAESMWRFLPSLVLLFHHFSGGGDGGGGVMDQQHRQGAKPLDEQERYTIELRGQP